MTFSASYIKRCGYFLSLFIALSLISGAAFAGAWTQKQGALYFSQTTGIFSSNDFYDVSGAKQSTLPYSKYETQLYVEYGLSDDWTAGANISYAAIQRQFTKNIFVATPGGPVQFSVINGAGNSGWVDPEIFVRRRIFQDTRSVLSGEFLHKFPTQLERNNSTIAGTEERDLEFAMLAGTNFEWLGEHHFIDTRAAYRIRGGQLKNQKTIDLKLGLRFWDDFLFIPAMYFTWSDEVPDAASFARDGREDFDLTKAEITIMYDWSPWLSLQISGFSHLDGKNVGDGEAASTGLVYRF